jgi:hypothetical protein
VHPKYGKKNNNAHKLFFLDKYHEPVKQNIRPIGAIMAASAKVIHCSVKKATHNDALLWKIALLGMQKVPR